MCLKLLLLLGSTNEEEKANAFAVLDPVHDYIPDSLIMSFFSLNNKRVSEKIYC